MKKRKEKASMFNYAILLSSRGGRKKETNFSHFNFATLVGVEPALGEGHGRSCWLRRSVEGRQASPSRNSKFTGSQENKGQEMNQKIYLLLFFMGFNLGCQL